MTDIQSVVYCHEVCAGVLHVKMQDEITKNGFSRDLVDQLIDTFARINRADEYKAVILTGYDQYFCTGATRNTLHEFQQGKGHFSDVNLFSLAINCKIPVIAAMQGHGIGGGFTMGLFADFVILSQESSYTTNYMKYGFTPGMGATLIIPEKFGISLAGEMLFLGKRYRGSELERRGVPFPVIPRNEVGEYALNIARQLAEVPHLSLITLKNHLVSSLRDRLSSIIEEEVKMHDITFHQKEVKEKLNMLWR